MGRPACADRGNRREHEGGCGQMVQRRFCWRVRWLPLLSAVGVRPADMVKRHRRVVLPLTATCQTLSLWWMGLFWAGWVI